MVPEEEYLRTSFSGLDQEYRDGELVERSIPDYLHGKTQLRSGGFFGARSKTHKLFSTTETRLRLRPGRYLIPDVSVFWPDEPTAAIPEIRPLITIEILSPDDRMSEVREKLQEYVDWGVPHVWLVDPRTRTLYECRDGLHEVSSFSIPEAGLKVSPADIFD